MINYIKVVILAVLLYSGLGGLSRGDESNGKIVVSGSFSVEDGTLVVRLENSSRDSIIIKDFWQSFAHAQLISRDNSAGWPVSGLIEEDVFSRGRIWIYLHSDHASAADSVSLRRKFEKGDRRDLLVNSTRQTAIEMNCLIAIYRESKVEEFKIHKVTLNCMNPAPTKGAEADQRKSPVPK